MRQIDHPVTDALVRSGRRKDWLARQLGISPAMLAHYLSGRKRMPPNFYREAALVLGVPESELRPAPAEAAA